MMEFYTVKEVSEILKVSQHTVRRLIREKEIPMVMIGANWRIPAEELNQYIKENTNGQGKGLE